MVKKILKGAAVVTGCFLAATAAGTVWFTGTESGLRTVVSAVRAALPGFSVEKAEGTLFHPTFRNVAFAEAGTTALVRELAWQWRWKDLFSRRVTFDFIKADGAAVKVAAATQTSAASDAALAAESSVGLPDWLPEVKLSRVTISDASVETAGTAVSARAFQMGVMFDKGHLAVREAALAGVRVTLSAPKTPAEPTDLRTLQTTLKTSGLADYLPGELTFPIGVAVQSFKGEDWTLVQGRDVTQVNDATVSLTYEDGRLVIGDCRVGMPQYGEAQLSGTVQTYGVWPMQLNAARYFEGQLERGTEGRNPRCRLRGRVGVGSGRRVAAALATAPAFGGDGKTAGAFYAAGGRSYGDVGRYRLAVAGIH